MLPLKIEKHNRTMVNTIANFNLYEQFQIF
jgi:hypothetical protein